MPHERVVVLQRGGGQGLVDRWLVRVGAERLGRVLADQVLLGVVQCGQQGQARGAAGWEEPADGVPLSEGGVTEAEGVPVTGGVVPVVPLGAGVADG
ncbi:hypothetical protein [Streptomyces sp. NPDC088246]|uniref:hypothetical protein n=1 Tax=Streptomyces sp. NPDC088246 TaxID=3365842 RepID=UPI0037F2D646